MCKINLYTGNMDHSRYHHGDLRRALIVEGLALLEEQGLAGLSLRSIAARAGVSHAAPKNHFGNLRGLLTAMAAEGFRRHCAAMREGLPRRAGPSARQMAALRGYVRFAEAHPHLFGLMFSSAQIDFHDPELGEASAQSYAVLREIAADLDWDKAAKPDAALRAEMMLWSLVHGYAQLAIAGLFAEGGPTGGPKLPIEAIVPRFGYREPV
jgi:AcrR family transcriptional regulator